MSKFTFKWFLKSEESFNSKLSHYPCPSLSPKMMKEMSFSFPKDTCTHRFFGQTVIVNIVYLFCPLYESFISVWLILLASPFHNWENMQREDKYLDKDHIINKQKFWDSKELVWLQGFCALELYCLLQGSFPPWRRLRTPHYSELLSEMDSCTVLKADFLWGVPVWRT